MSQREIAELFGKDSDTIGLHLKNIFSSGELEKSATTEKYSVVRKEGNREVKRSLLYYNLDAIISVGYRVNSKKGTQFRIWATKTLKNYLIKGYSVNEPRLRELKQSIRLIQDAAKLDSLEINQTKGVIQVLSDFALGLDLLDGYDHQSIKVEKTSDKVSYKITYLEAIAAINQLRVKFGGSNLFGNEKDESFKSSISAIDQTFEGVDLYPSIEEKAAHLLYFVVKNHSFTDGNKRIEAWLFVWYLNKNGHLYRSDGKLRIENNALAAMTLMIALSKPEEKDLMIKVVVNSINELNS